MYSRVDDCKSAFLQFTRPFDDIVLCMTNLYGGRKYANWTNIDIYTLHAYYGLLLLAGVYRSYGECLKQLWDVSNGRPVFRATMPLNTFKRIHGCIRFDDRLERDGRDKIGPIRNVYDKWNNHLKALYTVGTLSRTL